MFSSFADVSYTFDILYSMQISLQQKIRLWIFTSNKLMLLRAALKCYHAVRLSNLFSLLYRLYFSFALAPTKLLFLARSPFEGSLPVSMPMLFSPNERGVCKWVQWKWDLVLFARFLLVSKIRKQNRKAAWQNRKLNFFFTFKQNSPLPWGDSQDIGACINMKQVLYSR